MYPLTGQASKEIFICVIVMSLNWNVYNSIKKKAHIHQHPRKSNNILLDIKLENGQECMINTGPNILKHSNENYKWTPDAKLVLINQYLTGKSMTSVASSKVWIICVYMWNTGKPREKGYDVERSRTESESLS